jgi:centrosomal CEP192-like protein/HYDIN/CFA65/VesB family protein
MRSSRLLLAAGLALLAALLACSKKSTPTAPPPPAACQIQPTSLNFGAVTVGNVSSNQTFTLTNSGSGTLTGTINLSCPDFTLVSGAGSYSLSASQSRAVTVRFNPLTSGNKSCTVSLGCSQGVALSGVGTTAACALNPATLDFGSVTVGQSAEQKFTLQNASSATIAGTLSESCPAFAIIGASAYTLAAGQVDTFAVRFSPTQAGLQSCTIATGSPGCPQVTCSGTGTNIIPGCVVDVAGLSFPQVGLGQRADATFTLTNMGGTALVGTVTEDCADFSIPGQASYNLAPNQSQSFIVRFAPSQLGEQTCDVRVGPGCPSVNCWGSGVTGCVLQPTAFDFGYVLPGDTRCESLTLTNNTSTLQEGVLIATRTGGNGFAGFIRADGSAISGTEPLLYTLNAGQSRTFNLCWTTDFTTPCDTILGVWKVWSDACRTVEVPVRGVITKGCECSVAPTSLDFGQVIVGDTSPTKSVTISNRSGINGLRGPIRVISGDFVAPSSYGCCPVGNCAVFTTASISFRPTRLGPQTGKIVVENLAGCFGPGAGAICDTVTVTGVGVTAVGAK